MRKLGRKGRLALGLIGVVGVVVVGALFFLLGRTRVVEVADGVHVLRTGNGLADVGANVVVFSGDEGLLVVDTQLAPLSSRIGRLLGSEWSVPLKAIVNTHWHPDHTGGNEALVGTAPIFAHATVAERLGSPQEGFGLTKPGSHHSFEARGAAAIPTRLVRDTVTLSVGRGPLRVRHHPRAHSDGDLVVYAEDTGVIVVGDLVWPESFPFVDIHNGGNALGLAAALREIVAGLPSTTIVIPGHGEPITGAELASYSEMVRETIEIIREWQGRGVSLEEAQQRGLGDGWAHWSSKLVPTSEWIAMVYRSVS